MAFKDILDTAKGYDVLISKVNNIAAFEGIDSRTSQLSKYTDLLKDLDKTQAILAISSSNLSDENKKYYIEKIKQIPVEVADNTAKTANITSTSLLAAVTDKLSAAWAKLTAFMSANPLILLGTVAVGLIGTVYGLSKAYEHFTVSLDEAKEATSDAVENYQEITSEIESVESKLKDLNSQINDLDPITDADQISALKEESAELERQLTILEEKQRLAKEAANTAAQQSLGMTTESKYQGTKTYTFNTSTMQGGEVLRGDKVTQEQELRNAMNAYDEYAEKRKDIHEEMARLSKEGKGDTQEFKKKQKEYDDLTQKMQDARTHANELTIAIEEQMAGLSLDSDASREIYAKNKAALDWNSAWLEAIETGKELTEVEKQIHGLNSYFDGSTAKNAIRDKLLDVAKTKGKNADLVDELAKMGLTLEDIGLTAEYGEEALTEYFGSIVDAANEAATATKKVTMSVSGVESAFETKNSGADWFTMSDFIDQAGELYKKGMIGTDDFQSVVQWISPVDVVVKEGERAAEAYARVWKEYSGKIKRYFDQENPLDSMWNFAEDLEKISLAKIDGNDISFQFKTTAEAADALGISVQAVDSILHNLEDYGFEFDNIDFSGDLLSEYEKGLNNIKSLYNDLPSGSELKKNLEGLIDGFDSEYTEFEGDLSKLTKEHIIQIEFEYSIAQLESEIEELQALVAEGDDESRAALNVRRQQLVNKLEEGSGYESGSDEGYEATKKKIESLRSEIAATTDEQQKAYLQSHVGLLLELQAAYQEVFSDDKTIDWNKYLATDDFEKSIADIAKATGLSESHIQDFINSLTIPDVKTSSDNAKEQISVLQKVEEAYNGNNISIKSLMDSMKKYSKRQLEAVDLTDDSSSEIEESLLHLMNTLGVGTDEVDQFVTALADIGVIQINNTSAIESLQELEYYLGSENYTKVVELIGEDNATGIINLWNELEAEEEFATLSADDQATYIIALWNSLTPEEKTAVINAEDNVSEVIEEIDETKIDDKIFAIKVKDWATETLQKIHNWWNKITNKTVTITAKEKRTSTSYKTSSGKYESIKADGTFNSFAKGTNVSIDKDQKALVNEVRNEGLVRNGVLQEIEGGAQFINLKRGDIIFNHKQLEELKKFGHVTSGGGHGRLIGNPSFAEGTINAFEHGSLPDKGSDSSSKKKSSSKSSSDSAKEETSEFFDWLERKIQSLQNKIDKWMTRAEQAFTTTYIKSFFNQASKNIAKLMNTQYQAYSYYLKKANEVGLSDSYKKKVQNGSISISEITNENTKEKIQKYQEYWDKAQESLTAFEEAADQFYNIPLEEAARKVEVFSEAIEILEAKIDNAIGAVNKNKLIDQQLAKQAQVLSAQNTAKLTADKNVQEAGKLFTSASGIPSDKKDYVKEHVDKGYQVYVGYFTEGTEAYEAAVRYNEALQAKKEANDEYNKTLQETIALERELAKAKFDNIAEDYNRKIEMLDHGVTALDNKIAEVEARGQAVSVDYYKEQIKLEEQKKAILLEEEKVLKEQLKTIPEGTEEWYDAYAALQDVSSEISKCTQNTYELNNAINEAVTSLHENIHDEIDRLMDEQEFLREMMSHEKFVDDDGNFTEAGYANLASLTASLEASKHNAANDKAMIDRLDKMIESGELSDGELTFNSMEELEVYREQMYDQWRDDIKETYDLENEIYDLQKERYQAQIDAMQEIVDSKKEALQAEKD